jgi:DNA-binding LacI/PurR family transcriptional regulator
LATRVTIKDVARESDVDISTVSRCLNDTGRINQKTRDRIFAAAARLNYRPNRVARGLVTGRSQTFGLIVSDIRNPFFAELARGVEDAAYAAGFDVVLCNSDLHAEKQLRYVTSLVEKAVDGIIINYASAMDRRQEKHLASLGVPVVLLNRPESLKLLSTVSADNFQGGFLAGSYLLKLGHRRLLMLGGPEEQSNHAARKRGFLKGVQGAQGVQPLVLHGDQNFSGGYQLTWKALASQTGITAVFASNDVMAFGAIRALTEAGKRVPEDISVIGFDNVELSGMIQPRLTTIDQPKYEIGRAAVELLLELSRPGNGTQPVHRVFGVQLIERQSTRSIAPADL